MPIVLSLIPLPGFSTESPDPVEKELLLRLSDAYSQCAAYYGVAGAVLTGKDQGDARHEAGDLKKAADALAVSTAERLVATDIADSAKVKLGARRLANANKTAALNRLLELAKQDQSRFRHKIAIYSSGCKKAIRDPSGFADTLRKGLRRSKPASPAK